MQQTGGTGERVLGFEHALETVLEQAGGFSSPGHEEVQLSDGLDRVLAKAVHADRDQPPFPRSTRDGFAVRSADLLTGGWLNVAGLLRAGEQWSRPMEARQAVEIMTGAPVPADADAVVMLEHVERSPEGVRLSTGRTLAPGDNIVPAGSEARRGAELLTAGTVMGPSEVALAASCGASSLVVYRRPVVAVIATGDELVDVTQTPGPAQIRNSNSYGLAALIARAGGVPLVLPAVKDRRGDLDAAILEARKGARKADLLLLSGGVSMGKYDLVEESLAAAGAVFHFTGVRLQPGKPTVFGALPERDDFAAIPFFGLPGNPVSTQVTFSCFVEPMIHALRGAGPRPPRFVQARLAHDVAGRPALTRVLPAQLNSSLEGTTLELVNWQGSGDMAANARADCYAVLPEGASSFAKGDTVSVLLK